jgi:hypothetical protein
MPQETGIITMNGHISMLPVITLFVNQGIPLTSYNRQSHQHTASYHTLHRPNADREAEGWRASVGSVRTRHIRTFENHDRKAGNGYNALYSLQNGSSRLPPRIPIGANHTSSMCATRCAATPCSSEDERDADIHFIKLATSLVSSIDHGQPCHQNVTRQRRVSKEAPTFSNRR